jgi:calcium-dependent protein kinase
MVTHTHGPKVIENGDKLAALYDVQSRKVQDDTQLTKGIFGFAKRATFKATGATRGVERIRKDQINWGTFERDMKIIKMVDHPNLLMLYEIFEEQKRMNLVWQLCSAGNVSQYMKKSGHLNERQAAAVTRQVICALSYLHNHSIAHRDLKAENCMLVSGRRIERSIVKVGGYGAADILKPGQIFFTGSAVGTLTHMAPEVLQGRFGLQCDMWSCGIMLYNFLSESFPLKGETDEELREHILTKKPIIGKGMADVSQLLLNFVDQLLVKKPESRLTAKEALIDEWITSTAPKIKDVELSRSILKKVLNYRRLSRLQRAVLHCLISMLPEAELDVSRNIFNLVDADGDGAISMNELRKALGIKTVAPDTGDQTDLTYTEFVAATVDLQQHLESKLFHDLFDSIDTNVDGALSLSELSAGAATGALSLDELMEEIHKVDIDGDGKIDFAEFKKMMKRGLAKQLGQ